MKTCGLENPLLEAVLLLALEEAPINVSPEFAYRELRPQRLLHTVIR